MTIPTNGVHRLNGKANFLLALRAEWTRAEARGIASLSELAHMPQTFFKYTFPKMKEKIGSTYFFSFFL